MDYRKPNTLLIIVTILCVCKVKGSDRYVECNNITRVQIYEQYQSIAILEYTSLRGCKKQCCKLKPFDPFSQLYIDTLRFNPHDTVSSYVRYWQDKELELEFDADSIIIQPNKTSKLRYELPRTLTASGSGNFYISCTTECPAEGNPFPAEDTTKRTSTETSEDKSFPAYAIAIIVIVILLLTMSSLIAAFFTSRKMKKFLRRKKNLSAHSAFGCPEFGSDNNNDYVNDGQNCGHNDGVDMKLGIGYKSLDVLNDTDDDHIGSTNRSQPLTLSINPVDRNTDSSSEAPADPHLYANLSSPVNSLKPKALVHLTTQQHDDDPYDRVASPTNSDVPSALYLDPEQDWSTRAPLMTPTGEHADESDSEHDYDYTYMSVQPQKQSPGNQTGTSTDPKEQYSEVNKSTPKQKVSGQIKLLDSKVPIKNLPNQKAKSSPTLVPKPKPNPQIYDNMVQSPDQHKITPKPLKTPGDITNTKVKGESPKLLPKPKLGNVHHDNVKTANPLDAILKVQLRPTKSSAADNGLQSKKNTTQQSPKVQLKQAKSTPNEFQSKQPQPTNKLKAKPIGTPPPAAKQTDTNSNVNHFVKLKPVNDRLKSNEVVENSKSSPVQAKKALMPPKTPFKPKTIMQ